MTTAEGGWSLTEVSDRRGDLSRNDVVLATDEGCEGVESCSPSSVTSETCCSKSSHTSLIDGSSNNSWLLLGVATEGVT